MKNTKGKNWVATPPISDRTYPVPGITVLKGEDYERSKRGGISVNKNGRVVK